MKQRVTRRGFLMTAASVSAATMVGCPPRKKPSVIVYRRSARGRHVSNAAKKHAANHLYTDALTAALDKANPGDNCKVVELTISRSEFDRLFPNGQMIADLRHVKKR